MKWHKSQLDLHKNECLSGLNGMAGQNGMVSK